MQRQTIPNTLLSVSPFCLGTAVWGSDVSLEQADAVFHAFVEAGGNFFDTAHCYAYWINALGASERTLGELIRHASCRKEVVIATKCGHPGGDGYARSDDFLSPEMIDSDVTESLERLGVDYLDLLYLHRDDGITPVGEVMDALNSTISSGRVRYLGASNWSIERIEEANAYASCHGLQGFVASSPQWSLAAPTNQSPGADPTTRFVTANDANWYCQHEVALVPYTPTANGYFSDPDRPSAQAFQNALSIERLHRAQKVAAKHGVTAAEINLAYLLNQPFQVIPILGTSKVEHLQESLAAVNIVLDEKTLADLGAPRVAV